MDKHFFSVARHQARNSSIQFDLGLTVLLVGLVVLIASLVLLKHREDIDSENSVARCERLGQILSNRSVSLDFEPASAASRRQRNLAFETCMENPQAFEHIVAAS